MGRIRIDDQGRWADARGPYVAVARRDTNEVAVDLNASTGRFRYVTDHSPGLRTARDAGRTLGPVARCLRCEKADEEGAKQG